MCIRDSTDTTHGRGVGIGRCDVREECCTKENEAGDFGKRQLREHGKNNLARATFLIQYGVQPGSYTHLDVYKRQELIQRDLSRFMSQGTLQNLDWFDCFIFQWNQSISLHKYFNPSIYEKYLLRFLGKCSPCLLYTSYNLKSTVSKVGQPIMICYES